MPQLVPSLLRQELARLAEEGNRIDGRGHGIHGGSERSANSIDCEHHECMMLSFDNPSSLRRTPSCGRCRTTRHSLDVAAT